MPDRTQTGPPQPLRPVNPGVSPTGGSCFPSRSPGGEYAIDSGSCLAGIGLIRGGDNTGALACAGGIGLPEEGTVLAPWVAIQFEGTGSTITVGNDSSPSTDPKNVAIIKSFEMGYSDGFTCRAVIHDQEGGSFVTFMEHLFKDWVCLKKGSPAAVRMKIQFGWAKAGCSAPLPAAQSRCFYCLTDSVETNYHDGKFITEITGKDTCNSMFEGSAADMWGGQGQNAMPLRIAVEQFMTNACPPNLARVRFCRMEGGTCNPCPFLDGDDKLLGPKGVWRAEGQNKLYAVLRWLSKFPSDRGKGWMPQYNSEVPGGEIIFWEDPKPKDTQPDSYWDQNCIGTYIVNGGKRSPVLEFNPKIRWNFAMLTSQGGQTSSETVNATGQKGSVQPGEDIRGLDAQSQPCAGANISATSTETHKDNFSKEATKKVIKGLNASQRAIKVHAFPIEADLVIVGNPTILPPSEAMMAKNVTIIVINPYYLRPEKDSLEWLAKPTCNEVLSSKAWITKSITHRIESGKYTTTIGVMNSAPGDDIPPDAPMGGWQGGWRPAPQC